MKRPNVVGLEWRLWTFGGGCLLLAAVCHLVATAPKFCVAVSLWVVIGLALSKLGSQR